MIKMARCLVVICMMFFVASCCFGQSSASSISESEKAEKAKEAEQWIEHHRQLADQHYESQLWQEALTHYQYILPYVTGDVKADIQKKIIECKEKAAIEESEQAEKNRINQQIAEKHQLERQRTEEENKRAEAEKRRMETERTGIITVVVAIPLILLFIFAIYFVVSFNAKSEANKAKTQRIANWLTAVLGFFVICYLFFSLMQGGKPTGSSVNNYTVFVHAQDFVRDRLPCPSTAKFPSQSAGIFTDLGNNKYEYAGYVDSQNVYGAMVRSKYYVKIEFTGNECRLLDITIE